ncbi:MAG: hypothetical protein Q8T11_06675 [Elusimicrobiota bacterium]|nr:hypothetical protein [Elusimicrobiota bacterium]
MRRLTGLIGSWALFVLGFGLASIAVAGQWINVQDSRKLRRYAAVEKLLSERVAGRSADLLEARERSGSSRDLTRSSLARVAVEIGRTRGAGTLIGVPAPGVLPDGYFVELARKNGLNVLRLGPGRAIDADTGRAARRDGGGVWNWIGKSGAPRRVLTVENGTVVETSAGIKRALPSGTLILAGGTLVIPPRGTPQRRFVEVPAGVSAPIPAPAPVVILKKTADPAPRPANRRARLLEIGESIFGRGKKS